jgi:Planctomycete cytochrome C
MFSVSTNARITRKASLKEHLKEENMKRGIVESGRRGVTFQKRAFTWIAAGLIAGTAASTGCTWDHVPDPTVVEPGLCFETDVMPVFVAYCGTTGLGGDGCHNPTEHAEGYDFTTYNGIMRGVTAGRPGSSRVIEAMRNGGEDQMPPANRPQPTSEQIATIEAWIEAGAINSTGCATVSCDSGAAVTYSGDLQPMLNTYCNGCHGSGSPSAGIDLTNFNVVKQNAISGRLVGVITGNPSYIAMPPNSALLPSCYATKIERWVAAGAPNN